MKRTLTLLTLLLPSTLCMGQSFAPIGAKWYYSASTNGAAPTGSEYYLYESVLDTFVSGHACKKITITYFKFMNGDTAYLPPVFTFQSSDTVYYFNEVYLNYFPLYIFDVQTDDTLIFHSPVILTTLQIPSGKQL